MFTFNRNEQIAILILTALLVVGSIVSTIDYFWPDRIEDFAVRKAAIPVPDIQTEETSHVLGPIDVNTAAAKELKALPLIGQKTADRILAYRAEKGPFKTIPDLAAVHGIGAKTVEKLRPLVTLGSS